MAAPVLDMVTTETREHRQEVDGKRAAYWSWSQNNEGTDIRRVAFTATDGVFSGEKSEK